MHQKSWLVFAIKLNDGSRLIGNKGKRERHIDIITKGVYSPCKSRIKIGKNCSTMNTIFNSISGDISIDLEFEKSIQEKIRKLMKKLD